MTTTAVETVAQRIVSDVRATGGSTQPVPTDGYMVSLPDYEEKFSYWSDETVADYIARHGNELSRPGWHVGAWLHDGQLFLDVSVQCATFADALTQARQGDQLAFWDVTDGREVRLWGES